MLRRDSPAWVIGVLAAVGILQAQATRRLEFEVASIKPEQKPRNYIRIQDKGGSFVAEGTSLHVLIEHAYSVARFQISGGPDWIHDRDTQFYVQAKLEGAADGAQLRLMLQSLLEDRFKLKLHRETKPETTYQLVPHKQGPKVKLTAGTGQEGCLPFPATCTRITMADFVDYLSKVVLEQPVTDKTGLTGLYDLTLRWQPDDTQFRGNGGKGFFAGSPADPSIFTAMEEQLGLKLESVKTDVETLVIDSVELPSEN